MSSELTTRGIETFYDEEQQIALWGKNLGEELQRIYMDDSYTVVMFISREYAEKNWTRHERKSALSRALRERRDYVLPVRFDTTELPGLDPDVSYLKTEDYPPEALAEAIANKLELLGGGVPPNYPFARNAACPGQVPAVAGPGYGPGGQALPPDQSSGSRRPALGRRTIVLGSLAAAASAAVPAALILSKPARSSPPRVPAPLIVTENLLLKGHRGAVHVVAFRPHHSTTLASCSQDGTIRLWDTNSAAATKILRRRGSVGEIAFSPDGWILASGDDYDPTVRLWDMSTWRASILPGQLAKVYSVAFSRDGTKLASGSPGPGIPGYQVQLWDVASRHATNRHFTDFPVHAMAFSRDGDILALAGGGSYTVQLWNLATKSTTVIFRGHTSFVNWVAFSPDGKTLASASDDKTIRLWDVATGGSVAVLRGHTGRVASVAFSPGGKTLASGSYDYTVRLWDLAVERTTVIFRGHQYWVNSVAFNPNGTMLASGGYDYTVRLWQIPVIR